MDLLLSPAFRTRAEALLTKYRVPGLAIAVTHRSRTETRAFGLAQLDPPTPCTPDTLFDVASASKSMTAAAVALLVEDGRRHPGVRWDAVVSELLPGDFVMPTGELTRAVTLDDIVSHRTGMPTHDWSYLGTVSKTPDTSLSVTRNLRHLPVSAPLRTKYMYNNMMYTVCAQLVQHFTNLSFSAFLEQHFFSPLGMRSSSLQPSRARAKGLSARLASGYSWVRRGDEPSYHAPVPMVECPEADGAGSIITSVSDYILWVRALLHRQAPVTEEVYAGLLRGRAIVDPDGTELEPHSSPALYGAGLEVDYYRGHQRVQHGGGVTGFASKHLFLPAHEFGVVVAANSGEGGHAAAAVLVHELVDEVLGVPVAERMDWEALVDTWEAKSEEDDDPERCEAALTREILESIARDQGDNKEERDEQVKDEKVKNQGKKEAVPQPLTTPLETYAGTYEHPGYHQLILEIKDGKLFVDASERSFGFTAVFNHVADQRLFTLRMAESQAWGGQDLTAVKAEFTLDDGNITQLGIALDPDMDDEMIWFMRK
ncbi:hypothetical protein MY11210_000863 [Beauveria gryllotalpidicola]